MVCGRSLQWHSLRIYRIHTLRWKRFLDPFMFKKTHTHNTFSPCFNISYKDVLCVVMTIIYSCLSGTESGLPEHELKLLKLARILRLAKLTKLAKVSAFARRMDEAYVDLMVTYPGVVIAMRMFKLILVGVSIVHYMSCG